MKDQTVMEDTIRCLTAPGKGILAADESHGTIQKRFTAVGVESTEENRRFYRSLLVTAPEIEAYIAGIIFFEETLGQRTDEGEAIPEVCAARGIVPGVKVDRGTIALPGGRDGEKITEGLDGLASRLETYRGQGARFTKWRDVYTIGGDTPSPLAVEANAEVLARYAAIVQQHGMVPIVEPEVLMDGDHTIERCAEVSEAVLHAVFAALYRHRVVPELTVLKPNMVLAGKEARARSPEEVAETTLRVLRRAVPAAVPAIHFLSGGQSPTEATATLNAINAADGAKPWELGFSYGRALQQPAQLAWAGNAANKAAAQHALAQRARLNSAARQGRYAVAMEEEAA